MLQQMQQSLKIHRFGTTQVSSCHLVVWGITLSLSPRCTHSISNLPFFGREEGAQLSLVSFNGVCSVHTVQKLSFCWFLSVCLACPLLNIDAVWLSPHPKNKIKRKKSCLNVPTFGSIIGSIHPVALPTPVQS